jgi:hypothetical protein
MKPVKQRGERAGLLISAAFAAAFAAALIAGCAAPGPVGPRPETVFAVTSDNRLIRFNAGLPGSLSGYRQITGLQPGERIVGLDFRPSNGRLYGVGTAGQLYLIDSVTAIAEAVGPGRFRTLASGDVGFDFDPAADLIRFVTANGDNLRLDPDTGTLVDADPKTEGLQPDADLAYARGEFTTGPRMRLTAAAYSNSVPGAKTTTLFGIERSVGVLVTQGTHERAFTRVPPESGLLYSVGLLGVALGDGPLSFDVSTANVGILCVSGAGRSELYQVDLRTGAAGHLGSIGVDAEVTAIAIAPPGR